MINIRNSNSLKDTERKELEDFVKKNQSTTNVNMILTLKEILKNDNISVDSYMTYHTDGILE
jgi:hypothetical protein